jgi:hypothetical protein
MINASRKKACTPARSFESGGAEYEQAGVADQKTRPPLPINPS